MGKIRAHWNRQKKASHFGVQCSPDFAANQPLGKKAEVKEDHLV
jgi:hypothetical protein